MRRISRVRFWALKGGLRCSSILCQIIEQLFGIPMLSIEIISGVNEGILISTAAVGYHYILFACVFHASRATPLVSSLAPSATSMT